MEQLLARIMDVTENLLAAARQQEWDRCRELLAERSGLLERLGRRPGPFPGTWAAQQHRLQVMEAELADLLAAGRDAVARELQQLGRRRQGPRRDRPARYINHRA